MAIGFTDRSLVQPDSPALRDRPVRVLGGIVRETSAALLLRDEAGHEAWLPKRHLGEVVHSMFGASIVTLPAWLAIDKGFAAQADEGTGRLL